MDALMKAALVCGIDAVRGGKMHVAYDRICDDCAGVLRFFEIEATHE
jgi:hypothetical protein